MTTQVKPEAKSEPDARIRAARENWMIRFTSAGVPVTDFIEVTQSINKWDDWCAAWCARAAVHEAIGRECLARSENLAAGLHLTRAALEYHYAKFLFTHDVKQMRDAHMKAVVCRSLALPHLSPPGARVAGAEGKVCCNRLRAGRRYAGAI